MFTYNPPSPPFLLLCQYTAANINVTCKACINSPINLIKIISLLLHNHPPPFLTLSVHTSKDKCHVQACRNSPIHLIKIMSSHLPHPFFFLGRYTSTKKRERKKTSHEI